MSLPQPPSELRAALADLKPYYWRAFGFALLVGLLALAPAGYMLEVYDRVVNSRSHVTLLMLTLLVALAFAVMEVLDWARAELMREAGLRLDGRMAPRVLQAMHDASLGSAQPPGLQPMTDFRQLRDFLHHPVIGAVMESPVALVFLLILYAMSPALGWAALAGAVLQVGLTALNERVTNPPMVAANRASTVAQQFADRILRHPEVIESMGMRPDMQRRWQGRQAEFLKWQALASYPAGFFQAASKFLQTTMASLLLGLGAWLFLEGLLPGQGGAIIVGSILGGRMLAPLVQIVSQWRAVVNARDAWQRLDALLTQVPAQLPAMPLPPPTGHLVVEQLVAQAPGSDQAILKGLSFDLPAGQALAVVGPSAAGKTTLARLLLGLWPASKGKVRLDGADVYQWPKEALGPYLGYLPQGVELLEGSIAENIARFGPPDAAKVEAAARAVGLHELILDMPQGYDTQVGREGHRLSGGQRQRVALARALYGAPRLVVLDEPNASLDEAGDAALAQAIAQGKAAGTTFVVMTHRTSILQVVDKMLLLRDGNQLAFGPRDEVLTALQQPIKASA
jgi:ATP-binding cassette subfamily C exporter for protease/lipase